MMEKGIIPKPPRLSLGQKEPIKAGAADYYNIDQSTLMHLSKN
jgi:hypothetical protein